MTSFDDTIYALSSAPGRAGVAVVRVSGNKALEIAQNLCGTKEIPPRQAVFCTLKDKDIIDKGLVLFFKNPASFTGEDVVEFHVHGGRAVVTSMLDALSKCAGTRLAEPGEFTRRAFENGKLDLTAAEAVADLIDAETEAQKNQALAQYNGVLSTLYHGWAETLKKTLAHQEAEIEFPDEDMPKGISPANVSAITKLKKDIADHLDDARRGERLRDGMNIVIIGAPNTGKSSLINALARRDVAIVSDIAGTTRDVIEVHLDLGGYPVIVADTAGLRSDDADTVEAIGIERARLRARTADFKILLFDASADALDPETLSLIDETSFVVINKADLKHPKSLTLNGRTAVLVSARTGEGLKPLLDAITHKVSVFYGTTGKPSLTRERHRTHLGECLGFLDRALAGKLPELAAEDLRLSLRALGKITGAVHVEDLLDVIFRDFCIGK